MVFGTDWQSEENAEVDIPRFVQWSIVQFNNLFVHLKKKPKKLAPRLQIFPNPNLHPYATRIDYYDIVLLFWFGIHWSKIANILSSFGTEKGAYFH